jgi:hypothetical protein
MADLNNRQLAVWLAYTTRTDLRFLLNQANPTAAQLQALASAGLDPTDPSSEKVLTALKSGDANHILTADQAFHQMAYLTLGDTYPPPNCPRDEQLLAISNLP